MIKVVDVNKALDKIYNLALTEKDRKSVLDAILSLQQYEIDPNSTKKNRK